MPSLVRNAAHGAKLNFVTSADRPLGHQLRLGLSVDRVGGWAQKSEG